MTCFPNRLTPSDVVHARGTRDTSLRGVASSERLGLHRWKVERTLAWVLAFRRLTVRYDRHAASVLAFLHLACVLICLRLLRRAEAL